MVLSVVAYGIPLVTAQITINNPTVAPLAPAPAPVAPAVDCVDYMSSTGCAWTRQWSCPGQTQGSSGEAGSSESTGYKCCCEQGLWQSLADVAVPTPAPAVVPVAPVAPVDPGTPPGGEGPEHLGQNSMANEVIPRSVQLKHKLLQWFENTAQCPLNVQSGTPAWTGWKAVTASAPAVTTPKFGIAGNRTMRVEDFCPSGGLSSDRFTCEKENGELKARYIFDENAQFGSGSAPPHINIDGLSCRMKDIVVYRLEGQLGARLDFTGCTASVAATFSGSARVDLHQVQTAAMNMALSDETAEQVTAAGGSVQFTEFMLAVCDKSLPAKSFRTPFLPKFARSVVNGKNESEPSCFSETANTAHVLGKGCFADFLFFDLEDQMGNLAKIPAKDLDKLSALVPRNQHWKKPVAVPAPPPAWSADCKEGDLQTRRLDTNQCVNGRELSTGNPCAPPTTPSPKATCENYVCPAPTTKVANANTVPCAAETCSAADQFTCCAAPTTTVTTTLLIPEVPGVVIADRVCLSWVNCGACNNLCDCKVAEPQAVTTTTTTPWHPVEVCKDYWVETLCIAVLAFLICLVICWKLHDMFEDCILGRASSRLTQLKDVKKEPSQSMFASMHSMYPTDGNIEDHTRDGMVVSQRAQDSAGAGHGHTLALLNLLATLIVAVVVVIGLWFLWDLIMKALDMGDDDVWNGIDLLKCPLSLAPIIIALWLMNWLGLVYFKCYNRRSRSIEKCVVSELNVETWMSTRGGFGIRG